MNYRQRTNEYPSVKPFGFTGIISKNSNLTIEKSYIEKGTSFVNAFNNSNVILKDCGTPKPIIATNEQIVKQTTRILKSEKDTSKLPPWINYKIICISTDPEYEENNLGNFERKNKFMIRLDPISVLDRDVIESKNNINDRIKNPSDPIVSIDYTLENQLSKKGIYTSNISNTKIGFFALKYVESAIKAVWPLDEIHKNELDSPLLNLHFVNREIFPMTSSQNKVIKIDNIAKLDDFGNRKKISEVLSISKNTHKKIVKVIGNIIQYEGLNMRLTDNRLPLEFVSEVSTYYIMEPYYNSRDYICYYRQNGSSSNLNDVILMNDEPGKENTLYFRYNNELYSLFDVINERVTIPVDLNEYYLKNRINSNYFTFDTVFENKKYIAGLNPNNTEFDSIPDNSITIEDKISSYLFEGEIPALNRVDAKFYRVYDENTLYKNSVYLPGSSFILAKDADKADITNHIINGLNEPSMQYNVNLTGAYSGTAKKFGYKDKVNITTTITDASILSTLISTYIASSTISIAKNANYSVNFTQTDIPKLSGYTITQHQDPQEDNVSALINTNGKDYCVVFNNAALPIRTINFGSLSQSIIQELPSINNKSLDLSTIEEIGLTEVTSDSNICISSYNGPNAVDDLVKEEFKNTVYDRLTNYIYNKLSALTDTYKPIEKHESSITNGTYLYYDNKFTKITNYKIEDVTLDNTGTGTASTGIKVYELNEDGWQEASGNFKITLPSNSIPVSEINQYEYYYNEAINLKQKININNNSWVSNFNYIDVQEHNTQKFINNETSGSIIYGIMSGLLDSEYISSTIVESSFISGRNFDSHEYPSQDLNWFKYTIENELKLSITSGIENPEISSITDLGYELNSGTVKIIIDSDVDDSRCTISAEFTQNKDIQEYVTYEYIPTSFKIISSEIENTFDFSNSLNNPLSIYQEFVSPNNGAVSLPSYLNENQIISISGIPSSIEIKSNDYLTASDFNKNEDVISALTKEIKTDFTAGSSITDIIFNRYDGIYFNIDESKEEIKLTDRLVKNEDGESYHLYADHSSAPSTIVIGENYKILKPSYLNSQDVIISLASGYPSGVSRVQIDLNATGSAIAAAKNSSIKFYYDANEKIPVEFTNASDNVLALHDFNGSKIYIDNDDPKQGYRPMKQYVYEAQNTYELADFNDWYDIDTYVNYSLINSNIITSSSISISSNALSYQSRYAEITNDNGIEITSNISSNFNMKMYGNIKTSIQDHNLSTLFVFSNSKTNAYYPGYKAFSFNFMIPSKGWNTFDDEMYAENKNWMTNVKEDDLYQGANLSNVTSIANKLQGTEFSGYINIRYHLLKTGSRDINKPLSEHYTTKVQSYPFTAKVFSDSFNSAESSYMMFSLVSNNNTLNFSTKLNASTIGATNAYSTFYDLKNFTIDYENQANMSGKIQLNDLNFYIQYLSGSSKNELFISTISPEKNKKINLLGERNLKTGNISGSNNDPASSYISFNEYINKDILNIADVTYYKQISGISNIFDGKADRVFDNQHEIDELTGIFTTSDYHSKQEVQDIQNKLKKLGVSSVITSEEREESDMKYIHFQPDYVPNFESDGGFAASKLTTYDSSSTSGFNLLNYSNNKWEDQSTPGNLFDYAAISSLTAQITSGAYRGIYTDIADVKNKNNQTVFSTWNHNKDFVFDPQPYTVVSGEMKEYTPSGFAPSTIFNFSGGTEIRITSWFKKDTVQNIHMRLQNGCTTGSYLAIGIVGKYKYDYSKYKNHTELYFKRKGLEQYVQYWSTRCNMDILVPHVSVEIPENLKYVKFGNKWFKQVSYCLRYNGCMRGYRSGISTFSNYYTGNTNNHHSYLDNFGSGSKLAVRFGNDVTYDGSSSGSTLRQ